MRRKKKKHRDFEQKLEEAEVHSLSAIFNLIFTDSSPKAKQAQNLPFNEVWRRYEIHSDRAMPHTVSEQLAYHTTFNEFVHFATDRKIRRMVVNGISDVTPQLCEEFSAYLKTTDLAVDTHNRKIKRLRKIFDCLKEYYDGENPFRVKSLLRNACEEQDTTVKSRFIRQCSQIEEQG